MGFGHYRPSFCVEKWFSALIVAWRTHEFDFLRGKGLKYLKIHEKRVRACAVHFFDLIEIIQGVSKKSRQFRNGSQPREAASSMKFFVNIDCLGTCDVE